MRRTLTLLGLSALVLLGAWLIWPAAEKSAPVEPDATAPLPAREAEKERVTIAPVRHLAVPAESEPSPPAGTARLVVQCVARPNQRPLVGVRVDAIYADIPGDSRLEPSQGSSSRPGDGLPTDGEGRAAFEVESGRALRVTAHDHEHFVSQESVGVPALSPGETRALRLEHDAGENARFCGLVVAREDGRPLEKAEVRVNGKQRTSTDSAGRFELDYASHLAPAVRIDARGFGPAGIVAGVGHESAEHARRITLDRAASLVIALQVPEGQQSARVTLRAEGYEISQDQTFTAAVVLSPLKWEQSADAAWSCRFEDLPPNVRLVADVIGSTGAGFHAAEPIVLAPGEARRIEWDLRGCEIIGHVYEEDGKVASGVSLWLLRGEAGSRRYAASHHSRDLVGRATSAEDGSFRFGAVAAGTWILAPKPVDLPQGATPADAIAPAPLEITIRPGELRSSADVHLVRGLYIRGTLVAPDGATGVQGVVLGTSAAGVRLQAYTNERGVFAIGPLARDTFSLEGRPFNTYLSSLAVPVRAGARDVVLRARPGAEVAGKVIDGQSGAGVAAAITIGSDGGSMTITRTKPDGTFRLDGLEPGRYTLSASTTAGQAGVLPGVVLDTGAPVSGLEVVLERGAKLRIRYQGNGVGEVNVRRNGANIGGDAIDSGTNLTQIVAPGRITVVFRYPDRDQPETRELEIGAGEERDLVFTEPAGK